MKFAVVLILAKYLATRNAAIAHPQHILISSVYAIIPCGLALLQPDLGSVLIMFSI
jgi:cell division protein FtsW (lipid II flippase)